MKKRKLRAVLLTISLAAILLTGCGKTLDTLQPEDKTNSPAKSKEDMESVATTDTEDKQEENQSESQTITKEASKALEIAMRNLFDSDYAQREDEKGPSFSSSVIYPVITLTDEEAENYPALQQALLDYSKQSREAAKTSLQEMKKTQQDILEEFSVEELENEQFYMPSEYKSENKGALIRGDNAVLSILETSYTYLGGAHPVTYYASANFDPKTGETLKLADVVTDKEKLIGLIKQNLYQNNNDLKSEEQSINEYFDNEELVKGNYEDLVWTIGYESMYFGFSDYALGSYAMGNYVVEVPLDQLTEIINERYLQIPDEYMVPAYISYETGYGIGISEDVEYYDEYDYSENKGFTISYGDSELYVDMYYFDLEPTLVKTADGNKYLLVELGMESDYRTTKVFRLPENKNGEISELAQEDVYKSYQTIQPSVFGEEPTYEGDAYYIDIIATNPNDIKMRSRGDFLGTCDRYAHYKLTTKGLMQIESYYMYDIFALSYTTHLELTADEMDPEQEKVLKKDVSIPVGTKMVFYRSDGETYMDFKVNDGRIMRVNVTRDEDGYEYMNGVKAYDAFGELWYAG